MSNIIYRWGAILMFSLAVSLAFLFYGLVFQRLGSPPETLSLRPITRYFLRVTLNPLFIIGLCLAFLGALIRMFMFDAIGIASTALAGQLTIVLTVVFSILLLGDSLGSKDLVGMILIMVGVYLVQAEGGIV